MSDVYRFLNETSLTIDRSMKDLFQDEFFRVESHGHSTSISCINDTAYSIWKPYREIKALLDDTFISIKKGVTLNMRYISRMTNQDCTTRDGRTYLLRREQAKEIRERGFFFVESELKRDEAVRPDSVKIE